MGRLPEDNDAIEYGNLLVSCEEKRKYKPKEMLSSDEKRNYQDLEWAVGLNAYSLRLMGVWPVDDDNEDGVFKGRTKYLGANVRVPIMIATMLTFLVLPQFYALVLVIDNLSLVIDNLMTSCAAFTSCLKLFFLWRGKTVLEPVVRSVREDWLRPNKLTWERDSMLREAARARIFTISGYLVLAGCYCGFAVAPIVGIDIRMITNITDYGRRHLFVQSYFPYDYSQSPNYELTLLSQFVAGLFVGMSVSIPENYFGLLVFHSCAQWEILGARVESALDRSKRLELGRLVDRHVKLIRIIQAVESSFAFVIASQMFCMTVMVCCLGFQIVSIFGNGQDEKPPLLQVFTLVATLFTLMMHTLVDCFACEELAFRSTGVFDSAYKCDWYGNSSRRSNARDLIPMMAASKEPRKLTAGKIFTLSLATYCNILKSAAGYMSMLIAVNGK